MTIWQFTCDPCDHWCWIISRKLTIKLIFKSIKMKKLCLVSFLRADSCSFLSFCCVKTKSEFPLGIIVFYEYDLIILVIHGLPLLNASLVSDFVSWRLKFPSLCFPSRWQSVQWHPCPGRGMISIKIVPRGPGAIKVGSGCHLGIMVMSGKSRTILTNFPYHLRFWEASQ